MKKYYGAVVLNKEELKESNSNRIELEYYKISKKMKEKQKSRERTYGVEIIKKEYFKNGTIKEKNNSCNLTNDENVINKILNILKIRSVVITKKLRKF